MIYFDNAATTKPFKESLDVFNKVNTEEFFNPSALYLSGFNVYKKIGEARKYIINTLGGKEDDQLIFTSGATESNNIAIFGSATNKNKTYLFSMGEHPAVYNCGVELKNRGYKVDFIPLQKNGEIDYNYLEEICNEEVCFLSVMLVNNETGAINDFEKIREILDRKSKNCVLHVDAVQGYCKIDFNVSKYKIDLCSISAHKIGGIKGVGALYISKQCRIKNINFGGGQEFGIRSGTVNGAGILSFLNSIKIMQKNKDKYFEKVDLLKKYLIKCLSYFKDKVRIVSNDKCSPYITSLLFIGQRGETIMRYLDSKQIIVGTGSACSSNKVGNRVLEAMGYQKSEVIGAIRISFGFDNSVEEIDQLIYALKEFIL